MTDVPLTEARWVRAVEMRTGNVAGRKIMHHVLAGLLGGFSEIEKAIETYGRTPKGREVVSAHSQILQRAKWLRAAPDTTGARLKPGPIRRPGTSPVATKK